MDNAYQHRIDDTGELAAERRINRLAKRLYRLNAERDAARIISYREEICCLVSQFFFIRGTESDELSVQDDAFVSALTYALKKAAESDEYPFTYTLRMKYKFARSDEGEAEQRAKAEHDLLDESAGDHAAFSNGQEVRNSSSHKVVDIEALQDRHLAAALGHDRISYVECMSQTVEFLDSLKDSASASSRFWTPLFYTETLTRVCKGGGCSSIASAPNQEKRLFKAANLRFLDSYADGACRDAKSLLDAPFNLEFDIDPIVSPEERLEAGRASAVWNLPAAVYVAHCETTPKGAVTTAAVSQQRAKYESLREKFEASRETSM